jgi:hypothetical protein
MPAIKIRTLMIMWRQMESFFFAETTKSLYLLLDPDTLIDLLNNHSFNTEAHPVQIFPAILS